MNTARINTALIHAGGIRDGADTLAVKEASPLPATRGRGALSNPAGRFALSQSVYEPADLPLEELLSEPPRVRTEVRAEQARSIIARNSSPDLPFSQSINPYQGCEHGCIYCYARPSHAYWDLSPGLDFETRLAYKANAAELLEEALTRPRYRCRPIALGSNTDPYQPLERELRVTRQLLEVLQRHSHPFTLVTKSSLVLRDLDILEPMARQQLCSVRISVTTLDRELKNRLEPRTASPAARLKTIEALNQAGVPVGVFAAPVIPTINDHELESILEASRDAGARTAAYILIRLPLEVQGLFEEWLVAHYPGRARHVMSLIRQCRGGQANDARFGQRMTGTGYFADMIAQRFRLACTRLGLVQGEGGRLTTRLFRPREPVRQMSLF